jgi:hypothetical protein
VKPWPRARRDGGPRPSGGLELGATAGPALSRRQAPPFRWLQARVEDRLQAAALLSPCGGGGAPAPAPAGAAADLSCSLLPAHRRRGVIPDARRATAPLLCAMARSTNNRPRGGANTSVAHMLERAAFGGRGTRTGHPVRFTVPRCEAKSATCLLEHAVALGVAYPVLPVLDPKLDRLVFRNSFINRFRGCL